MASALCWKIHCGVQCAHLLCNCNNTCSLCLALTSLWVYCMLGYSGKWHHYSVGNSLWCIECRFTMQWQQYLLPVSYSLFKTLPYVLLLSSSGFAYWRETICSLRITLRIGWPCVWGIVPCVWGVMGGVCYTHAVLGLRIYYACTFRVSVPSTVDVFCCWPGLKGEGLPTTDYNVL